jgi:hypothetical protein
VKISGSVNSKMATYQDFVDAFAKDQIVVDKPHDIVEIFNRAASEWDLDFYKWLCRHIGKDAPPEAFVSLFSNCLVEHIKFVLDYIPSLRTIGYRGCSRWEILNSISGLNSNVTPTDIIEFWRFMQQIGAGVKWNDEERISAINKIIGNPEAYDVCLMILSDMDEDYDFQTRNWRRLLIDCNLLKEPYDVEDAKYLFEEKVRSSFWLDQIFMTFRKKQTQEFADYIILLDRENGYYLSKRYGSFTSNLDDDIAIHLFSNGFVFGNPETTSETVVNLVVYFNQESFDLIHKLHAVIKNKYPKFLSVFTLTLNKFFSDSLCFKEIKQLCKLLGDQLDLNSPDLWRACGEVSSRDFAEVMEIFKGHPDKQDYIASQIIIENEIGSINLSKFRLGPYSLRAFFENVLTECPFSYWPRKEDLLEHLPTNPRDHVFAILYLYNNLSHESYSLLQSLPIPVILRLEGKLVHVGSKSYKVNRESNMFVEIVAQKCKSCATHLSEGVYRNSAARHGIYYCATCAPLNGATEQITCMICMDDEDVLSFIPNCSHAVCMDCLPKLKECPLCKGPINSKPQTITIADIVKELSF